MSAAGIARYVARALGFAGVVCACWAAARLILIRVDAGQRQLHHPVHVLHGLRCSRSRYRRGKRLRLRRFAQQRAQATAQAARIFLRHTHSSFRSISSRASSR